jgi:putative aldouronate transport system permease protein
VFLVIFRYVPMYGVVLAFRRFDITSPFGGDWVGLWYFEMFFTSRNAWKIIRNTFVINFYSLLFAFPAPIILALLINEVQSKWFAKTFQIISYLPHFISVVIICSMIHLALSPSTGFVNNILRTLGFKEVYFMIEPRWFRTIYIVSGIWQQIGWGSIIYIAAISGINVEIYEAAVIDGAGRFRQAIHVTLPSIASTVIILLILRMGRMLSVGAEKILLLYNPMTYDTADVLSTYLFRVGLVNANYSLGTAVGLANSVVSLILLIMVNYVAKRVSQVGIW